MAILFENKPCTRCGGAGKYSYCHYYGDRCFKCQGSGVTLTKRGAEAQRYFRHLFMVKASEIKPGDIIKQGSITNGGSPFDYYAVVESVAVNAATGQIDVTTISKKFGKSGIVCNADHEIHLESERKAKIEKGLAYQETLTKSGSIRKTKAAKAGAVQEVTA